MRPSPIQRLLSGSLFKFCVVGLSSTVVDKTIYLLLLKVVPIDLWWLAQSISFLFGVTNGYYWNRRWTFAHTAPTDTKAQYLKFVLTNFVGLLLTLILTKGLFVLYTGRLHHAGNGDKKIYFLCGLCAIPIVVIWNFTASRLWTFKSSAPPPVAPAKPVSRLNG